MGEFFSDPRHGRLEREQSEEEENWRGYSRSPQVSQKLPSEQKLSAKITDLCCYTLDPRNFSMRKKCKQYYSQDLHVIPIDCSLPDLALISPVIYLIRDHTN